MKIVHWVKKERSGLFITATELAKYEERAGHSVSLRVPHTNETFYGFRDDSFDIHCIHSQIHPHYLKDSKPKILFLHGHPYYSVELGVSIPAVLDLVSLCDAFVSFVMNEAKVWKSFKRTYYIPKGIDLEKYKPTKVNKKLKGNPSVVFCEHWRNFKHPLGLMAAMERVIIKLPDARLYPFGCNPGKQQDMWLRIVKQNHFKRFCPGIFKWQQNMVNVYNACDMVVSGSLLSAARTTIEALACGKPVIGSEFNPYATYRFDPTDPDDIADKIIACHNEKPTGMRKYAEENHSAKTMADDAIKLYKRFV